MTTSLLAASKSLRAAEIFALAVAAIAVIGIIDHDTGQDLSVVLFYLLPIYLAAWYAGRGTGLAAAFTATIAWYLADWLPGPWTWRLVWNVAEKFSFFGLFAILAARLKRSAVAVYEQELGIARDVQRGLFPVDRPGVAGFDVAARLIPNRALSGDYYDLFPRGGGFGLVMADVMGKGLAASLLTANLHALLHFAELQSPLAPPPALLDTIHRHLRLHSPGRYITLAMASFAIDDEAVTYAVAGHPPPLVWDGASVARLEATGLPLGLLPECRWTTKRAAFPPGALFVAYTDGVSEALDAVGNEYGIERITQVVESLGRSGATAEESIETLLAALRAWAGETEWPDDIAVVAVRNCR